LARILKGGQLVIVESTTFPGATDEVVRPALESQGRRFGKDFFLAFSPERVDPGNAVYHIENTPKIVGGCDEESSRLACAVYSTILEKVVPVSSAKAAETAKLLENSFRAVNIALVNEMAQICRRLGLDVWEVIGAAATKPFGFMPFYPGPGIGGHCIPKDPQLLAWKMKTLDFEPRFLELASLINAEMPRYTVERLTAALNRRRRPLKGSHIFILGVAYKPNSSDDRESPALDVIDLLLKAGARVSYHDPYVPMVKIGGVELRSQKISAKTLKSADAAAILTAHGGIDYASVLGQARFVFDARNAARGLTSPRLERL
jgi:UDP-N-acetyl-D-glucosamine dehydrogenase